MDAVLAEKSRAGPSNSSTKSLIVLYRTLKKQIVTFLLWLGTIVKEVALD